MLQNYEEMIPNSKGGKYSISTVSGETVRSYIPPNLPITPPLDKDDEYDDLIEKANRALGRLDGISTLLPDTTLFIYMYVRKEAVLSSQIEGTQSSLSDLLLYEYEEIPAVPIIDVQEVSNYVNAMYYGLEKIKEDFPISSRLIKELHNVLMAKGRGSDKHPGEYRKSQNWLGGTRPGNARYVPPPHDYVPDLISNLERFIHDEGMKTPSLIKAAIMHVQFETIHPFLDGNGRLGRLLITLLLCAENILLEPTLYLSLYFKTHREEYYELLQRVRFEGAWEDWLKFFLKGVFETSQQAFQTAQSLIHLFDTDKKKIETLGRPTGSVLQVHNYLQKHVFLSVPEASKSLNLSTPTILKTLDYLEKLEIIREITGKERNRLWTYNKYLAILSEGV